MKHELFRWYGVLFGVHIVRIASNSEQIDTKWGIAKMVSVEHLSKLDARYQLESINLFTFLIR